MSIILVRHNTEHHRPPHVCPMCGGDKYLVRIYGLANVGALEGIAALMCTVCLEAVVGAARIAMQTGLRLELDVPKYPPKVEE